MHQDAFYILPEDKASAEARIVELEQEIRAMGPDFYEALNQSSETWHDNAPFDALREKQSGFVAELESLLQVLHRASVFQPSEQDMVQIGSFVTLRDEQSAVQRYHIAGNWTPDAGKKRQGYITISCQTPVAQLLLGKQVGDQVRLGQKQKTYQVTNLTLKA